MQITERATINAPVARLWEILVTNYDSMGEWSSSITPSHPNVELPAGEQGRVCHTAVGVVAETIIHRDEQTRTFAYRTEKLPSSFAQQQTIIEFWRPRQTKVWWRCKQRLQ